MSKFIGKKMENISDKNKEEDEERMWWTLLCEKSLAETWLNDEEDEAWKDL